jgi:hypothetical protein
MPLATAVQSTFIAHGILNAIFYVISVEAVGGMIAAALTYIELGLCPSELTT